MKLGSHVVPLKYSLGKADVNKIKISVLQQFAVVTRCEKNKSRRLGLSVWGDVLK